MSENQRRLVKRLSETGKPIVMVLNGGRPRIINDIEQYADAVVDIMLPGIDGFAVCRKIREESDTPILIVSAKVDKEDKLNGLLF